MKLDLFGEFCDLLFFFIFPTPILKNWIQGLQTPGFAEFKMDEVYDTKMSQHPIAFCINNSFLMG